MINDLDLDRAALLFGDCIARLASLPENTFESCVTDPPYGLGFMGKKWDRTGIAFQPSTWATILRVLKPGAHLLAFGGTRTAHRMACAIEDAGFEIRDDVHWFYGTGFPKSLNLGGGQGTAVKPAHEPIYMARKPLAAANVASNVGVYGTGTLNIDTCRIGTDVVGGGGGGGGAFGSGWSEGSGLVKEYEPRPAIGRWPANVILDEDAAAELDTQSGFLPGAGNRRVTESTRTGSEVDFMAGSKCRVLGPALDSGGGASRFFYVAKASRAERDLYCEHLLPKSGGEMTDREDGSDGLNSPRAGAGRTGGARNFHPTVKPLALMRYLVRLVTPDGGTVLDPFAGSCSTGIAALEEGRCFVGVEQSEEYWPIAVARLTGAHGKGKAA